MNHIGHNDLFLLDFLCVCREKELVDSLLFLQPQARNEESKTQVVLVSSQAGCVCFRNITGEHHVYGEQRKRVQQSSNDQLINICQLLQLKDGLTRSTSSDSRAELSNWPPAGPILGKPQLCLFPDPICV